MLSVKKIFLYQTSNWSGFVPLTAFRSLYALERLPFALKSPMFQQSCNFSRTLNTRSRSSPTSSSSATAGMIVLSQSVEYIRKQSVIMYRSGDPVRPDVFVLEQ